MRIASSLCAIVLAGLCALTAQTPAQPPSPAFFTVTYIHVDSEKQEQYDSFIGSNMLKLMQTRAEAGEIRSWVNYKVVMPGGTATPYNRLSVITWAKHPILDPPVSYQDTMYKKAGLSRAADLDRLRTIGSKIVKRELWRGYEQIGEPVAVGDLVRIDPKRISEMGAYVALERDIWKPMHQQRIKQGGLKAWGAATLSMPGGDDYPYNAATVEIYKDEAQMFAPYRMQDIVKLTFPGKDITEQLKQMQSINKQLSRTIVRAQQVVRAKAQ
jgi:hypothetical protein